MRAVPALWPLALQTGPMALVPARWIGKSWPWGADEKSAPATRGVLRAARSSRLHLRLKRTSPMEDRHEGSRDHEHAGSLGDCPNIGAQGSEYPVRTWVQRAAGGRS